MQVVNSDVLYLTPSVFCPAWLAFSSISSGVPGIFVFCSL
jgi:hypothetical protein